MTESTRPTLKSLAVGYRTLLSLHVGDNYEENIACKLLEEVHLSERLVTHHPLL